MVGGQKRLVENQHRFRRANQRLHERVSAIADDDQPIPFLCECADESCMEPVAVTSSDYLHVRDDDARFLIRSGHPVISGEKVVEEHGGYAVVVKATG